MDIFFNSLIFSKIKHKSYSKLQRVYLESTFYQMMNKYKLIEKSIVGELHYRNQQLLSLADE